jgi:hypothetical protein
MIPTGNDRYISVQVNTGVDAPVTVYVGCPVNGTVRQILFAWDAAVNATNVITTEIAGVAITGGGYSATAGTTAAGTVKSLTPTAANTVLRGQSISLTSDGGGSSGTVRVTFLIEQN